MFNGSACFTKHAAHKKLTWHDIMEACHSHSVKHFARQIRESGVTDGKLKGIRCVSFFKHQMRKPPPWGQGPCGADGGLFLAGGAGVFNSGHCHFPNSSLPRLDARTRAQLQSAECPRFFPAHLQRLHSAVQVISIGLFPPCFCHHLNHHAGRLQGVPALVLAPHVWPGKV